MPHILNNILCNICKLQSKDNLFIAKQLYSGNRNSINLNFCFDKPFRISIEYNNLNIAKWIYENSNVNLELFKNNIFTNSCLTNNVELISWIYNLYNEKFNNDWLENHLLTSIFISVCRNNLLESAQWLYNNTQILQLLTIDNIVNIYILCAFNNAYDVIEWLYNKFNITDEYNMDAFNASCEYGYFSTAMLIYSFGNVILTDNKIFVQSCNYRGLEFQKWLYNQFEINNIHFNYSTLYKCLVNACLTDNIQLVTWIYEQILMKYDICNPDSDIKKETFFTNLLTLYLSNLYYSSIIIDWLIDNSADISVDNYKLIKIVCGNENYNIFMKIFDYYLPDDILIELLDISLYLKNTTFFYKIINELESRNLILQINFNEILYNISKHNNFELFKYVVDNFIIDINYNNNCIFKEFCFNKNLIAIKWIINKYKNFDPSSFISSLIIKCCQKKLTIIVEYLIIKFNVILTPTMFEMLCYCETLLSIKYLYNCNNDKIKITNEHIEICGKTGNLDIFLYLIKNTIDIDYEKTFKICLKNNNIILANWIYNYLKELNKKPIIDDPIFIDCLKFNDYIILDWLFNNYTIDESLKYRLLEECTIYNLDTNFKYLHYYFNLDIRKNNDKIFKLACENGSHDIISWCCLFCTDYAYVNDYGLYYPKIRDRIMEQLKENTDNFEKMKHYFPIFDKKTDIDISCNICFANCNNLLITKCNHIFCFKTIITWLNLKQTCPLCRTELKWNDLQQLGTQ